MRLKNHHNPLYGPLKLAIVYFAIILILFFWGPIKWHIHNSFIFIVFLLSYHLAFCLGYKRGIEKLNVSRKIFSEAKTLHLLHYLIYLNFIFVFIAAFRYSKQASFSIASLYNSVIASIADPGQAYYSAHTLDSNLGGNLFAKLLVFLSPVLYMTYPLGLYYIHKLKRLDALVLVITFFFDIARWLAVGTNKGVFDIVFIVIIIYYIKTVGKNLLVSKKSNIPRMVIVATFLLVGAIIMFGKNINSRTNADTTTILYYNGFDGGAEYNTESIFTNIGGDSFQLILFALDSYLTQGYYALSKAISLPWTPTYGIGNSSFLMDNVDPNIIEFTYQAKLEQFGIDRWVNWHSIYVWLANDFSFIGVIFIMYIIGMFWGIVFKEIIYTKNSLSIVLFCLLGILILYSPANNQIMNYPTTAMPFLVLTIYWLINR